MKTVIQIVLVVISVILTVLIYKSVKKPIDFEKAKNLRYNATIERLKDIRKAENAFKEANGRFTGSWDTLIDFVKHGSVKVVRKVGMLTDSMIEAGINERKAIQMGLIIRDTTKENVLISVFTKDFNPDNLKLVPVPDTTAVFSLAATILTTGSGIKVPVFEAKVHNNVVLRRLNRQLVINLNDMRRTQEKYPGLLVGSLTEANNGAGNWE
jgi:hypothetical protein